MKRQLTILIFLLASSYFSMAQMSPITVDQGTDNTVRGVAGNLELTYAFAKGDRVTITATASKQLERMKVVRYPDNFIGAVKQTKNVNYTFRMSQAGFVTFRFISDRGGKNNITYTVTRTPASPGTRHYATKVVWDKPTGTIGQPVPRQARD